MYKWCAVPLCKNTSIKTPSKLFIYVPNKITTRNKWLTLARRDPASISINSSIYFCEDHFDLPNDMVNYIQYRVMGSVSQVRMKQGCIPRRFECQPDRIKRTSNKKRPYFLKQQRKMLIEECEKDLERQTLVTSPEETPSESTALPNRTKSITQEQNELAPGFEEIGETDSKNIEIYIKEESIDIEENELEHNEIQLYTEPIQQTSQTNLQLVQVSLNTYDNFQKLEAKCSKLFEENEILKQNFLQLVRDKEILKKENEVLRQQLDQLKKPSMHVSDNFGNTISAEKVIDLTDISSICRICLKKHVQMESIHKEIQFDPEMPSTKILNVLASIGLNSIELGHHLPDKICVECEELVKKIIIFQNAYKKKSQILSLYISGAFQDVTKHIKTEQISDHDYSEKPTNLHPNENLPIKQEIIEDDQLHNLSDACEYEDADNKNLDYEEDSFGFHRKLIEAKKPPHTCPICFKELQLSEFRAHIRTHKALEKYLSGPKPSKKTKYYALPRDTVSLVNETEKRHNCPFCGESLEASIFMGHIDDHMRNDHFNCDKCGRFFKKRSFLLQHMLVHSKELPYKCETCNKGFVIKSNYDCHLLTHSHTEEELPHECEHCGRKFSNPTHLRRHKIIHLENRSYNSKYKRRRCYFCLQAFNNLEMFTGHRCQSTGGVRRCRYCDKAFTTFKTYHEHFQMVHKVSKKKPRGKCNICGMVYSNVTYHKIKMHPDKVESSLCAVCGLYVSNIYRHRYTHLKPFKCQTCSKNFAHSTVLKKHMLIHSGVKPFICSYCGKAFNSTYNLQVHERIHKGEKCHVCQICSKGFLEKSYLKKHMRVHRVLEEKESETVTNSK